MSDDGDMWWEVQERRRLLRQQLGVKCPACIEREPKRNPTILLPRQKCYCGYRDPRKREKSSGN